MDEATQEKYMQLQMIQNQLEELNKQQEELTEQLAELDISIRAVHTIEKTPLNNEFLAPLANGVFIKGEIKDTKSMIVNVGSGVTVEKSPAEVVKLLTQQKENVQKNREEIQMVLHELSSQGMKLYEEIKE